MNKKLILGLSLFLLFFTACGEKEVLKKPAESITKAEQELQKKKSFTAYYEEITTSILECKEEKVEKTAKIMMLTSEDSISKTEMKIPSSEENTNTDLIIYTTINPNNDNDLFVYTKGNLDDKWAIGAHPAPKYDPHPSPENGFGIHKNYWNILNKYKDKFELLEENASLDNKKADVYQYALTEEEQEELVPILFSRMTGHQSLENYVLTLWVDKESQLPLKTEASIDSISQNKAGKTSSKETLLYTGFDNANDLAIPKELAEIKGN